MYNPGTFCDDRARRGAVAPYGLSMGARQCQAKVVLPPLFVPTNALKCAIRTHMLDTTWKLRVSAEELELWKAEAARAGMLVSEWIREQCNAAASSPIPGVREDVGVRAPERREPVAVEPVYRESERKLAWNETPKAEAGARQCPHGIGSGWACWQCGGLAKA